MAAWIMSCTLAKAGTSLTCRALERCQIVIFWSLCRHLLPEGVGRASSAHAATWHQSTGDLGIVNKDCC